MIPDPPNQSKLLFHNIRNKKIPQDASFSARNCKSPLKLSRLSDLTASHLGQFSRNAMVLTRACLSSSTIRRSSQPGEMTCGDRSICNFNGAVFCQLQTSIISPSLHTWCRRIHGHLQLVLTRRRKGLGQALGCRQPWPLPNGTIFRTGLRHPQC